MFATPVMRRDYNLYSSSNKSAAADKKEKTKRTTPIVVVGKPATSGKANSSEFDRLKAELIRERKRKRVQRQRTVSKPPTLLRKISEINEEEEALYEEDLVFDEKAKGFTTLRKISEGDEDAITLSTDNKKEKKNKSEEAPKIVMGKLSDFNKKPTKNGVVRMFSWMRKVSLNSKA